MLVKLAVRDIDCERKQRRSGRDSIWAILEIVAKEWSERLEKSGRVFERHEVLLSSQPLALNVAQLHGYRSPTITGVKSEAITEPESD